MAITEKQLFDDVKAGHYAPVYLVTGEPSMNYYIDLVSDFFENEVIAEDFRDFDQTVLYGRDVDMMDVLSAANRFPMMSPVQVVLVKEAQDIPKEKWELLAKYLEHPQPQTILVFCYRHKKFDKRSKVYKAIDKVGVVYEHPVIYDNQLPAWIAQYVKDHGFAITQKAAVLLADHIGVDLGKIANELDKVFVSIKAASTIDEVVIERNVGISKDYNVFELTKAIGERNVEKCNRIVNHFAANPKENPIQLILPTLYNYFVKIMLYHQVQNKAEAAKELGVNAFFLRDYQTAAANYPLGKLASCIGYLYDTDLRSKGVRNSGTVTDGELLKELIFRIIHS